MLCNAQIVINKEMHGDKSDLIRILVNSERVCLSLGELTGIFYYNNISF